MEKLKPCPFCGGKSEIKERFRRGTANRKMFWVECNACLVSQYHGDTGGYATKAKAVKAWNRRAERSEDETH